MALQSLCGFKYFYNHRWDMGLGGLCGARIATEQDRDPEILYTIVEVRIEPSKNLQCLQCSWSWFSWVPRLILPVLISTPRATPEVH